jgi:hypothetical protein
LLPGAVLDACVVSPPEASIAYTYTVDRLRLGCPATNGPAASSRAASRGARWKRTLPCTCRVISGGGGGAAVGVGVGVGWVRASTTPADGLALGVGGGSGGGGNFTRPTPPFQVPSQPWLNQRISAVRTR